MADFDVTLHFDGASTFNCGPQHPRWHEARGAYGFAAIGLGGQDIYHEGGACDVAPCSSNMAELIACRNALRWALRHGNRRVRLRGDSTFVINFLLGTNRISQLPHIARLQAQIAETVSCEPVMCPDSRTRLRIHNVSTADRLVIAPEHVPRSKNKRADDLASAALKAFRTVPQE